MVHNGHRHSALHRLRRGDLTKEKEATTSLDGGDAYHGDAIEVHACGRCTMEH